MTRTAKPAARTAKPAARTAKPAARTAKPARPEALTRRRPDVPARILAKLRSICGALPGVVEEVAWVGVRWTVRKRNFAHVVLIENGYPPAYAKAAHNDGPLVVLTFRAAGPLYDALCAAGPPFFQPPWGIRWGTKVVGLSLDDDVDWQRVKALVTDSHALLATKSKARRG